MPTDMSMNEDLYQLMTWMSPSYPVGAYSFSHGLENAVESGLVTDVESTRNWIKNLLTIGDGHADLVFLAAAWSADDDEEQLREVHELALAFQPSAEIHVETTAQGVAFMKTTAAAWPCRNIELLEQIANGPVAYPVVVGSVARSHGVSRDATLLAYGHAFVANLVSAAVRLIPLGQTDGQKITSWLHTHVSAAVAHASTTPLQLVTSSCVMADIASMQHEVQYTRLFRS